MKKYEKPQIYTVYMYKQQYPWCATYLHKTSIEKLEKNNFDKTDCPRVGKIIKAMLLK